MSLSNTPGSWSAYRWPAVVVLVSLIALAAYVFTLQQGERVARGVANSLVSAAGKFSQGTITRTFTAAIPTIFRTPGGSLELASAQATETFTSSDAKYVAWNKVYLGTTVTEIKVPVTYRYHIRLQDTWRVETGPHACIVYAPRLRPTLPPAIHTDTMEKKSESGWARFNMQEQMEDLEHSLTPTVASYASDRAHLALVREACRRTVAEFVQSWLLQEGQWQPDKFDTIKVIFADETGVAPEGLRPTMELK